MAFWKCKGLSRLDEWEAYFRSEEGRNDRHEQAALRALEMVQGGCYDEIVEGPAPEDGLQYVEFCRLPREATAEAIAGHFAGRAAAHPEATLNCVLRRIGLLGPDVLGDPVVWTLPSYAAAEALVRAAPSAGPFGPQQAGCYRRFGAEIL